jgi:hypothetical protein
VTVHREPSWPFSQWRGRRKGHGLVPHVLPPGTGSARCDGERVTLTVLGTLLDGRLAKRAR